MVKSYPTIYRSRGSACRQKPPIVFSEESDAGNAGGAGGQTIGCVGRGDASEREDRDGLCGYAGLVKGIEALGCGGGLLEDWGEEDQVCLFFDGEFDVGQGVAGEAKEGVGINGSHRIGRAGCGFAGQVNSVGAGFARQKCRCRGGEVDEEFGAGVVDFCGDLAGQEL